MIQRDLASLLSFQFSFQFNMAAENAGKQIKKLMRLVCAEENDQVSGPYSIFTANPEPFVIVATN